MIFITHPLMKHRRLIFYIIIFFALGLAVGPLVIVLALIVPLIDYLISQYRARETYPDASSAVAHPGNDIAFDAQSATPSDTILVNPTRGSEPAGVILVYDVEGFFVYDGIVIRKADIVDITFNNAATPYKPNDYQVIIATRNPAYPLIKIPVGVDSGWAMEVVAQIKQHLFE